MPITGRVAWLLLQFTALTRPITSGSSNGLRQEMANRQADNPAKEKLRKAASRRKPERQTAALNSRAGQVQKPMENQDRKPVVQEAENNKPVAVVAEEKAAAVEKAVVENTGRKNNYHCFICEKDVCYGHLFLLFKLSI